MAFEKKNRQELRKHFEALLTEALHSCSRAPLKFGEHSVPEFPSTFRAGFRWALVVVGLIKESTTELSDAQLRIFCEEMHKILNLPPPPDDPFEI